MPRDVRLIAPRVVNLKVAEDLLARLAGHTVSDWEVLLDLTQCQRVDVGAGYRLGNALRRAKQFASFAVLVGDEDFERGASDRWFLAFTRSGLGPAISAHIDTVLSESGANVAHQLKAYYRRTLDLPAQNAVYFLNVHLGRLDIEDENRFGKTIFDQFRNLNVSTESFGVDGRASLVALCFEAVQNTFDHAAKAPLSGDVQILSYVSLRYYRRLSRPEEPAFGAYLSRLGTDEERSSMRFLEIVVNDDGVGIPGRQSSSMDTYWGKLDEEERTLEVALKHGSVKLLAADSKIRGGVAGKGFTRIREGLHLLRAFASVRTGRCLATFSGVSHRQSQFRLQRGEFGLPLAYMPGTALQIVIPFRAPETETQVQPSLF